MGGEAETKDKAKQKIAIWGPHQVSPWQGPAPQAPPLYKPPPPEQTAVPITLNDERITQGVRNVIRPAQAAGWTVRATYARGPYLSADGKTTLRTVDSIMVKGRRNREAFVAAWVDGKFEFAYAGPQGGVPTRLSASDLKARLA